jgi:hypothetical protein
MIIVYLSDVLQSFFIVVYVFLLYADFILCYNVVRACFFIMVCMLLAILNIFRRWHLPIKSYYTTIFKMLDDLGLSIWDF